MARASQAFFGMNIQLTFRGFPPSDAIRFHVEERATKLREHDARIVALKVALEAPHRHHHHGHAYRVRIELIVPGSDLVISPRDGAEGHTNLHVAIDDAFTDAERRLREHLRVRRGNVKAKANARAWRAVRSA
jgi:ribosomal subunit interface protein